MSATGLALLLATGMTGMQALQKAPQLTDAVIAGITDTPMKTQQKGNAKAATTDILTVSKKAADEVANAPSGEAVQSVVPSYAKKGTLDSVTGKDARQEQEDITKELDKRYAAAQKAGKTFDVAQEVTDIEKSYTGADQTMDDTMSDFFSSLIKGWGQSYKLQNGLIIANDGDDSNRDNGVGGTRDEAYSPDDETNNFRDFVNDSQGVSLESKAQQLVFGEATIKADGSYVQDKKSKDGSLEVLYFTDPMYDAGTTLYKIDGLASYLDPETGSTVYRKISNHNNTRFRDKYFQPYDKGTNTWNYNLYNLDKIR